VIILLHGKGLQDILTESFEDNRRKVLKDRSKYTDEQIEEVRLDDKHAHGGGITDNKSFIIKQFPYPINQSIKRKDKVDVREDPRTGGI
jgi:hypothetical protein